MCFPRGVDRSGSPQTHRLGTDCVRPCRSHNFIPRLPDALLTPEELHVGKVLEATVHIVECEPMWETALTALRKDPFCFVERKSA